MSTFNLITPKEKFKGVSLNAIEHIVSEVIKHEAIHKGKKRNTGKTNLIRRLSSELNISVSTIYNILKDAKTTVRKSDLSETEEYSAIAAYNIRSKNNRKPNNSKRKKVDEFVELVEQRMKESKYNSVDECVNYLRKHCEDVVGKMDTICTKTFYNYIHKRQTTIKPIDLPRMLRRKGRSTGKTYIAKRQKGTSITERPEEINNRSVFGHWEGDLVLGGNTKGSGQVLTLIERQTRFFMVIKIKDKTANSVLNAINNLHKIYGGNFSKIFKSITFDNGSEFAFHKEIELGKNKKKKRTTVYFGRPYRSGDRGSNENANGLIRFTIPKGKNIEKISEATIATMCKEINNKTRKIHDYLSAEFLFNKQLDLIL